MASATYTAMLERCFAGPGSSDALRLTLQAFDAAVDVSDREHCAVVYLKSERRMRVNAGAFNLVAPHGRDLAVTLPGLHPLATRATELGGYVEDVPKRHTSLLPIVLPRSIVPDHYEALLQGLRSAAVELTSAGRGNRPHDDALEAALRQAVQRS